MKHIYKRINRGIVLGVVLLVGLAAYIWKDETDFQKETPVIQQTVTSFMEETCASSVSDTEHQNFNSVLTKSQQEQQLKKVNSLIDKYWIDSDDENALTKSRLLEQVKGMVTENSKGNGYVQKCTVKLNGTPEVKKSGPSLASVETEYIVVMEYAGDPNFLVGSRVMSPNQFSGRGKSGDSSDQSKKRFNISFNMTTQLEKVNGTWKILSMGGGFGSSGEPVTIE